MNFCHCEKNVVKKTSWTDLDPGRRYSACEKFREVGGCTYFAWIDPPMCTRSRQIFPELLKRANKLEGEGVEMVIPPLFKCPISLDLFKDPVTLCTGQTYDRPCIQKWLESGNLTCPVTMQKLHDSSMVPNHTLRHLIDDWLRSNTRVDTKMISFDSIKKICESDESTLENKIQLGKSVVLSRQIVYLIQQKSDHEAVGRVRALSSLSLIERNCKNLAIEGAVEGLIEYLINAERSLAPMAMSTIEKLLVVESVKDVIANHAFGIKAIVKMVFRVSEHDGSECAINSLLIICSGSKNGREKAIVDGVLTQLLLLLQSQSNGKTKTKARMLLKLLRSMWNEDLNTAI
ncbi:hypothetical protein DH2020_046754 [Rehmannia glutinosa]|uniref:U-box domain-containing protein n=1 Tax=Rehmannia glutinosa TaxID=99300 RepID=A0ABR0UAY5_REHGL